MLLSTLMLTSLLIPSLHRRRVGMKKWGRNCLSLGKHLELEFLTFLQYNNLISEDRCKQGIRKTWFALASLYSLRRAECAQVSQILHSVTPH